MTEKTLRDYCKEKRGRASFIAREMRISPVTVGNWISGKKPIPPTRGPQLEKITHGIVSRKINFPNWAEIWPELEEKEEDSEKKYGRRSTDSLQEESPSNLIAASFSINQELMSV